MIIEKLRVQREFTEVEKEIASFILANPELLLDINVDELSLLVHTSAPSIVRFCKKLGFKGFAEFKIRMAMEIDSFIITDKTVEMDMPIKKGATREEIAKTFLNLHHQVLTHVYHHLDLENLERCAKLLYHADNIALRGFGPSLLSVSDFYYKMCKLGIACELSALSGFDSIQGKLKKGKNYCVIVSAYAVSTDVRRVIFQCMDNKVKTMLITCNDQSPLLKIVDEKIIVESYAEDRTHKMGSFASRTALTYILDLLYALMFSLDYDENINRIEENSQKKEELSQ